MVDIYDTASSSHAGRMVLGASARSHIFRSLSSGTHYSVAVRATAGPFHTSTPNRTHCTREYDALLAVSTSSPPSWFKLETILEQPDPAFFSHMPKCLVLVPSWGGSAQPCGVTTRVPGSHPQAQTCSISFPSAQTCILALTCVSSPGPLPPAAVRLLSTGHPDRLSASWGAAAGGRDGYALTLYRAGLGTAAASASLGRDTHSFTFTGLAPGYEYSLEASATAGPYQAAAPNVSGWTRECLEEHPLHRGGRFSGT